VLEELVRPLRNAPQNLLWQSRACVDALRPAESAQGAFKTQRQFPVPRDDRLNNRDQLAHPKMRCGGFPNAGALNWYKQQTINLP